MSGNAFGFIGNRMLFAYEAQAVQMAEEGVSPARIDEVIKNRFGFAMGPFAVADLSGLDVYHFISQSEQGAPLGRIPIIAQARRPRAAWDRRAGAVSSSTTRRSARAVRRSRDPEVEQLIAQLAKDAGIAQNADISDDEIIARCTRALADSGAELVRTGIALRPGDIDIVWIYGYGFPPHHGGPMWYAQNEAVSTASQRHDAESQRGTAPKPAQNKELTHA